MKKVCSIILAVTMIVGMIPLGTMTAFAETSYDYLAPVYVDGDPAKGIKEWETKSVEATPVTNSTATLSTGWYIVTGDVQTSNLKVNGDVNLILADGSNLTAKGTDYKAGITVSGGGNSLTVYAQSTGDNMGTLEATGGVNAAGIGGGDGGSGSNITVNGGTVTAQGGNSGAGIGGGNADSGSNITVNGGTVNATGGFSGAGIGGGLMGSGSNITVNGGTVTATGGDFGAGIGGGVMGSGSNITVNGGTVTAIGGDVGVGIGGGYYGSGGTLVIPNCDVILAGDAAPGRNTTTDAYLIARSPYVYIHNHIFTSFIDNGDGTHSGKCACGETGTPEAHTFSDGVCVCGAEEATHEHVFSTEWTTNGTAHWHACTADDCDIEDYATCGLEGAAYGTHTIVNGKCKVCNCDCPHKFENDSPVCTLCGKTFYRAYDMNLTGSTLTFKIDVLDFEDEPYDTYGQCYRFDMFLIASDNEPVANNRNYDKYYNSGCRIAVNEYGSTGDFPDNGVSNYVRNGNTFTVTISLDRLNEIEGFNGIYGLTAETTCVWLNIRPCSSAALDYDEPSWMRFYDSTMLVFKYGEYLVEAPKADGTTGTYNKRVYKVDEFNKVDLMAKAWTTDKSVTFEDWYLYTMIQYKDGGDGKLDIRFVSMLDENLEQYAEAGFVFTVEGEEAVTVRTTEAVNSYESDGKTYTIDEFSEEDDFFFLQKFIFASDVVNTKPNVTVSAYVKLTDGTILTGKSVTFNLGEIAAQIK